MKQNQIEWYDLRITLIERDSEERLESFLCNGEDLLTGIKYQGIAIFVCDELDRIEDIEVVT